MANADALIQKVFSVTQKLQLIIYKIHLITSIIPLSTTSYLILTRLDKEKKNYANLNILIIRRSGEI